MNAREKVRFCLIQLGWLGGLLLCFWLTYLYYSQGDAKGDFLFSLDRSTVMVVNEAGGCGSGICVVNGPHVFCWTAAHVLVPHQKKQLVLDEGESVPRLRIAYKDCWVVQEVYQAGRKVGKRWWLAEVVRYSPPDVEDLALLRIRQTKPCLSGVTFLPEEEIPLVGAPVLHVGSMHGEVGYGTPVEGTIGAVGRLRRGGGADELDEPNVYDQVTLPALCGASGGGVFLRENGQCVGLLTEGLDHGECFNYIVPARRIWAFARRMNCVWAVTDKEKTPSKFTSETDGPVSVKRIENPLDAQPGGEP